MKFSHSLQFNSVPDWADRYIAYSNLKKLVYQIERDIIVAPTSQTSDIEAVEESPLLDLKDRANAIFIPALDKELTKINAFYLSKEDELFKELTSLIQDFAVFENLQDLQDSVSVRSNSFSLSRSAQSFENKLNNKASSSRLQRLSTSESYLSNASSDDEDYNTPTTPIARGRQSFLWRPSSMEEQKIHLKKRTIDLFVWLSELKSFVLLNRTGFSKILKKYDKITNGNLKTSYINNSVNDTYLFKASTLKNLEDQILKVREIYANICTNADMEVAMRELKTHLREFIVWERNTVWRDIIGLERKSQAVGIKPSMIVDNLVDAKAKIETPFGGITISNTFWKTSLLLSVCIIVFVLLLNVNLFEKPEQKNCFALLIFVCLLWSTEVIPLFVTSLLIPLLVVCLRVLPSVSASESAHKIFEAMFSPVIMLLLGGFAIAGALSKYHVAKMMATFVLAKAGTRPSNVLLVTMFVATFSSMWISNVAAPVLCLSLIQPILRNLPPNSSFGRCLILGIALASNVGGMASPISSPQNIIAIEYMDPSLTWIGWFIVAIPLCIIVNILVWLLLLFNYKPSDDSLSIHPIRLTKDPWSETQIFVIAITVITIALWCVEKQLENFFGDMGIIAIIPLVAFFGTGILTKEDFNNFLWTVIVLAMGGIALGAAVRQSGLLHTIAESVKQMVSGLDIWQIFVIFGSLVVVVATFISHTVGALIILPIVAQLNDQHSNLLVMGSALICSVAMGLPVSGFPNMNAIMMEDEMGVRYLSTFDFIKSGIPGSLLGLASITTVGYGLMLLIGF
ncbi:16810_t:CDS:2 [Dentiscutata erythropus]|uniref:16810_t:CDS:1 n=1 Tax=Dentiscutata erythropus TaxID=1348616 RepID=A0A9N9DTV8_9GLOM|nr:16810_t:CDS:2 [Dentiscutata erythropus]